MKRYHPSALLGGSEVIGKRQNEKQITTSQWPSRKKSRGSLAMKIPKTTKRYCPYCKAKTKQKIKLVSTGAKRGALKRGSKQRARLRGKNRGIGNLGKWSKPAQSKFKRKSKTTKKTNIMYTCEKCGKSRYQKKGQRAGKQIQE